MKKIKYEKPTSLDGGQVAAVQGANCSQGNVASDSCISGIDPDVIPYCNATGTTATGNCWAAGGTAGQACYNTGGTPSPGTCIAGTSQ